MIHSLFSRLLVCTTTTGRIDDSSLLWSCQISCLFHLFFFLFFFPSFLCLPRTLRAPIPLVPLPQAHADVAARDALMSDAEHTVRCMIDELNEARTDAASAHETLFAERAAAEEAAEAAAHELRATQRDARDALQAMADQIDAQNEVPCRS